jgi:hypothetical protein
MVKATRRCVHADYLVRAVVTLVICGATVALTGCGGEIASGHRANNERGGTRSVGTSDVSVDRQRADGFIRLDDPGVGCGIARCVGLLARRVRRLPGRAKRVPRFRWEPASPPAAELARIPQSWPKRLRST